MTVKAGESYFIRLLYVVLSVPGKEHYVTSEGERRTEEYMQRTPSDILLSSNEKLITFDRAKQRAAGRYDVLTFTFRVLSNAGSQLAVIDIDSANTPEVLRCIDSRVSIPLFISSSSRRLFKSGLCAVVFACLYMVPSIFPGWFSFLSAIWQPILRDVSLVGIAISSFSVIQDIKGLLGRPFRC